MRKSLMTQTLSLFTSFTLVFSAFPAFALGPAAMPATPDFVKALTPPAELGAIASSYDAGGAKMPRLIVIADLHGHLGVQNKIIAILQQYVNQLSGHTQATTEQRIPIYIEGGWTAHLEDPLKSVTNPRTRSVLAEYLLKKSELPAAQVFSERNPASSRFTLTGVENKEEYEANRARFAETYPVRKKILEAIVRHEKAMNVLSSYVETGTYSKLRSLRQGYEHGQVSGEAYAKALVRQANRYGIQSQFVDLLKSQDAGNNPDFDVALQAVHRSVELRLSESRPLSSYLRGEIEKESIIRQNLAYADGYLDLLKRVLGNQLTPEEVPYALAVMPRLIQVAQLILGDEKLDVNVAEGIRRSMDFYPFAFLRDETMVKNSLAALDNDPTHPTTGILVAGGFHSGAIAQYLRDHRVSYMLVNPVVDRDITAEEQLNYIKRICNEHVTPDEVKQDMSSSWGRSLVNAPVAAPVSDLSVAATYLGKIGITPIQALAKAIQSYANGTSIPVETVAEPVRAAVANADAKTNVISELAQNLNGLDLQTADFGGLQNPLTAFIGDPARSTMDPSQLGKNGIVVAYKEGLVVSPYTDYQDALGREIYIHDLLQPRGYVAMLDSMGMTLVKGNGSFEVVPEDHITTKGRTFQANFNHSSEVMVAIANALENYYRENGRKMDRLYVQTMENDATRRYATKAEDLESGGITVDSPKETRSVFIEGLDTPSPVIMFNRDKFMSSLKMDKIKKMLQDHHENRSASLSAEDKQILEFLQCIFHEMTHAVSPRGQKGFAAEHYTSAESLGTLLGFLAYTATEAGIRDGVDVSAGASFLSTRVPNWIVSLVLDGLNPSHIEGGEKTQGKIVKAATEYRKITGHSVGVSELIDIIVNIIKPEELAQEEIKKTEEEFSEQLKQFKPEERTKILSEYETQSADFLMRIFRGPEGERKRLGEIIREYFMKAKAETFA